MADKQTFTRHLCASPYHKGSRWMLSLYFHRHSKHRSGLQSYCRTCVKIRARRVAPSEITKNKRREYTREYKEKQRRANGTMPRANQLITPYFRGDKLQAYLNRLITLQPKPVLNETNYGAGTSQMESYLNGIRLEPNDSRYIRRLGTKKNERTDLRKVDALAIKYDLPLWEMQEAAGCYKRDKRNTSKYRQNQ